MKSYAQNLEDLLLQRVFSGKEHGFYIDIGAHDPDELSVTKVFYDDFHWNGINVEPVPESHARFEKARPRDINVRAVISDEAGIKPFYRIKGITPGGIRGSALSSCSEAITREETRKLGMSYERMDIRSMTMSDLCRNYLPPGQQVDFLKIDAEGHEQRILLGADFESFRPAVVVMETTLPGISNPLKLLDRDDWNCNAALDPIMQRFCYSRVWFDGLNAFYLAEEHMELHKYFTLPLGIYDGLSVPGLYSRISELHHRVRELESK